MTGKYIVTWSRWTHPKGKNVRRTYTRHFNSKKQAVYFGNKHFSSVRSTRTGRKLNSDFRDLR